MYQGTEFQPPYMVKGEMTIPVDSFPKGLLEEMMRSKSAPLLTIQLGEVILPHGMSIESGHQGATMTFDFASLLPAVVEVHDA